MATFRNVLVEYTASATKSNLTPSGYILIDGRKYSMLYGSISTSAGTPAFLPPQDNLALTAYVATNTLDTLNAIPLSSSGVGTLQMIPNTGVSAQYISNIIESQ